MDIFLSFHCKILTNTAERFVERNAKYQIKPVHYSSKTALYKERILGENIFMSSLPGKALRTLVGSARLAE